MPTYAPRALLDLRAYLGPLTGLSDVELGIAGDTAHIGGYHHGWDQRRVVNGRTSDYSWLESPRDSYAKTNAASAFDIGAFARLRELSMWLVRECAAGASDTLDIREVIYSPDGVTVKRWDRLGIRSSGDDSHRTHTHISYFRDAEDRDKTGPFRRFFGDEDDVSRNTDWRLQEIIAGKEKIIVPVDDTAGSPPLFTEDNKPQQQWNRIESKVDALSAPELSDEQLAKIADLVVAKMPKPPTAQEIADLLAARLAQ